MSQSARLDAVNPAFHHFDRLPDNPNYCILDKHVRLKPASDLWATPLGSGNAGVVYLAVYKFEESDPRRLLRAIKFLSPQSKHGGGHQAGIARDELAARFASEIATLCAVTHTNICKIVDFGTAIIGDVPYPYYVMEYVEGDHLKKYIDSGRGNFVNILTQLVGAVAYIHQKHYIHMDVKEENVYVDTSDVSSPHVVLLDLGGATMLPMHESHAKASSDPLDLFANDSPEEARNIPYISSEEITRPNRKPTLGWSISESTLRLWNVDLDLYAVGTIIERLLASDIARRHLIDELDTTGIEALRWVQERLMEGDENTPIGDRYYQSASDLRADLSRLRNEYLWPLGLPELSTTGGASSIQLSRERVWVTPSIRKVINHPVFQRLRNIPQLEYVGMIFPGATQTRFEHSLRTFNLARMVLTRLLQDKEFRMIVTPEHIQATLLVALLHDVGHYPLSHMFEDFAEHQHLMLANDDRLFGSIVQPESSSDEFPWIREIEPFDGGPERATFHGLLSSEFEKAYPYLCPIMYGSKLRDKKDDHRQRAVLFLHTILNSAIDVDKVSYLIGDSAVTGVPFGNGIDVFGLLDALVLPRDDAARRIGAIAIRPGGLSAAEQIVMARFWMISRVYWNRTNRAIMAAHKFVIAQLLADGKFSFRGYLSTVAALTQVEATRYLSHEFDKLGTGQTALSFVNPLHGVLDCRRDIYVEIFSVTHRRDEAGEIYDGILAYAHKDVLTTGVTPPPEAVSVVERIIGRPIQAGELILDVPQKKRDRLNDQHVLAEAPHGDMSIPLVTASRALQGAGEDFEFAVKAIRIFASPGMLGDRDVTKRVRTALYAMFRHRYVA